MRLKFKKKQIINFTQFRANTGSVLFTIYYNTDQDLDEIYLLLISFVFFLYFPLNKSNLFSLISENRIHFFVLDTSPN
jgi:hypothetical protein